MAASRGSKRVEGLSKKENGLTDMDNSVVIAGGEGGITGLNVNGKNTVKIKFLKIWEGYLWSEESLPHSRPPSQGFQCHEEESQ